MIGILSALEMIKDYFFLVGYVTSSNLFPEPLSPKEEEVYIAKVREGDENAKKVLIERNLRLVAHIAKKYSTTGVEQEDIISIGTIGLIKAINSYKEGKGVKLRNLCSTLHRKRNPHVLSSCQKAKPRSIPK